MIAILLPIKPKWCAKTMNGDKTVEVRKENVGKAVQKLIDKYGFADIYGYCTKNGGNLLQMDIIDDNVYAKLEKDCDNEDLENSCDILNGKVLFKFRCYKVDEFRPFFHWCIGRETLLTRDAVLDYLDSKDKEVGNPKRQGKVYAIHISDLEIFDKPKELSEFRNAFKHKRVESVFGNNKIEKDERTGGLRQPVKGGYEYVYPLTKAPQSFCYVEIQNE